MGNQVTELDLRMPEFRDPKLKLEDLEFDDEGFVVRKDRFKCAMHKISGMLHGVNGLSARSSWTCDQVIEAVNKTIGELSTLTKLIMVVEKAPVDAVFYHSDNKEYVKNIDQEHLLEARKNPNESILVNHEVFGSSCEWAESSAWIEYINFLVSIEEIKRQIASILSGGEVVGHE